MDTNQRNASLARSGKSDGVGKSGSVGKGVKSSKPEVHGRIDRSPPVYFGVSDLWACGYLVEKDELSIRRYIWYRNDVPVLPVHRFGTAIASQSVKSPIYMDKRIAIQILSKVSYVP